MQHPPFVNVVSLWALHMPSQDTVLANHPFAWDASGLHDRPGAEAPLWVIPVSTQPRALPPAQRIQGWTDFEQVIRGLVEHSALATVLVTPHAKALLSRCWYWLSKTRADFPPFPATQPGGHFQVHDFVESLNWPAFLDLQDRRCWTPKRVAQVFGNVPADLDVSDDCNVWPVTPTLNYLHQVAATFT